VVLLFHGGSGHKRSERHLRMGHWLASTAGLATIAIDGPYHGDRMPGPVAAAVYQQLIVDEGIEQVTVRTIEDWLDTVSVLPRTTAQASPRMNGQGHLLRSDFEDAANALPDTFAYGGDHQVRP
jgi:hypothetical protein